jgi:hypothetical protein
MLFIQRRTVAEVLAGTGIFTGLDANAGEAGSKRRSWQAIACANKRANIGGACFRLPNRLSGDGDTFT